MPKSISRRPSANKPRRSTARKQNLVTANLIEEIEKLKKTIGKLKDDRSQWRLAVRRLVGHIRNTILDEPELPGKMPFDIRVQLLFHPTKTMRHLVKETKSSIAVKVDAIVQEFLRVDFPA